MKQHLLRYTLPSGRTLQMPVKTFLWSLWCIATYPLAILTGYWLFGSNGALYVAIILVLTNRGRL